MKNIRYIKSKLIKESFDVSEYIVVLKHDGDMYYAMTSASSKEQAIKQVCDSEHAPESAVISCEKVNKK